MLGYSRIAAALAGMWLALSAYAVPVDVRGDLPDDARDNILSAGVFQRLDKLAADKPRTLRRLLRRVPEQVSAAVEPFGYYDVKTETRVEGDAEAPEVVVEVTLGEPVTLGRIDVAFVTPDNKPPTVDTNVALETGDRFIHPRYESAKRAMQARLLNDGYLDARLTTNRVAVSRTDRRADVTLAWDTGPRYRFGEVSFQNAQLDDPFMQRFVPFEAGEYYSQSDVLELNVLLLNSGYFETVTISQGDPVGDRVPLLVEVVPRPRDLYEIGFSYGTDSGPGIDFGFERRYVNRRGHSVDAELSLSTRRSGLQANYRIPRRSGAEAYYALGLAFLDEETDTSERRNAQLSASRFGLWKGWRRTDSLVLLTEDFEIGSQDDTTTLLIPGISVTRSEHEGDELIPDRGHLWRGSISGAADGLLSETSFIQVGVAHKRIWPVGAHRLLARAEIGATWVDEFRKLPPSLRYFAGGDRSLRGFDYEALGPVDENGDVVGGEYLLLGSLEYEHHVRGPWRAAAFVDVGNAFSGDDRDLEYGIGVGARYATPIGLIRVDLAVGISDPDNPIRLHLIVGPDL